MAKSSDGLAVETRATYGTVASKALRRKGKIPATLYGHGEQPAAIAVDAKAFEELLHGGGRNRLLNLTIDGGSKDTALVRDVQRDPISRRVVHADFQRVGATESVSASLRVVTVGTAEGVRNFGGVMDVIAHTIEVYGPANELPEQIEADVSDLGIHEHLTAGDLKLPPNFSLRVDPGTVIVAIEPSRTESEAAEVPAAAPTAEVPTVAETTPAEPAP